METIQVTIEGPKELVELGQGVAKFLTVLKTQASDGFDPSDISHILVSAMADLVPALEGVTAIGTEASGDKQIFANGCSIIAADILGALLS